MAFELTTILKSNQLEQRRSFLMALITIVEVDYLFCVG